MYGGCYLKGLEINLEDAFLIQFPIGSGGPNFGGRKIDGSNEACLRHNVRLSLNQFMRPDFILVCYHLMCQSAAYTTDLIKCQSNYHGQALGKRISKLSVGDMWRAGKELKRMKVNSEPLETNTTAASVLKSVTTSCKVLQYTAELSKNLEKSLCSE